ncbi:MAG: diaminopimelate epimerase [Spirochaetales bacterium]|nr:diaminopimelate epimerase [Spirochaetales bacterium]
MAESEFSKYHGLGNDYIVIDPRVTRWTPCPEAVRAICDRNYGPGSDGILYGPLDDGSGLDLRIYNPDGSEAEKSGNGLRIFAWYLHERGLVAPGGRDLVTAGGKVSARIVDGAARIVEMDMGTPSFSARAMNLRTDATEIIGADIELGGRRVVATCVSMGNPHCVLLFPDATPTVAKELGPLVEHDPLFPGKTNVQFLEILSRSVIKIEIWERGAGYTLASGSSSCAAAAAARRLGLVDDDVTVRMPGGELLVSFRGGNAFLTGPVEPVFEGRFLSPLRERIGL